MNAFASSEPQLHAALNGDRDHPGTPRSPQTIAAEARAAVDAGAQVVHLHPFAVSGRQTFDAEAVAETLREVRIACPEIPISVSTAAEIEPDPQRRLALIAEWTQLPDLVSANQGEAGIREVCELLLGRGVAIEAGLLSVDDAAAFVDSGLADRCRRVLVEPTVTDPDGALAQAAAIERVLAEAGIDLPQVHHGEGIASWVVNARAVRRGHGIRTGLEDTPVLIDGTQAAGNGELIAVAAGLLAELRP
ncbi:3-keto-5-aminohexanoate cleavage protein [Brevibacterium spongiae]|uniref:3-keto-5-aminohexanoate cleavage protein n=1 Tax=Brevibacterium spongiae TaxID=2909672 RepID=A0ABY5SW65_9MICO|nr:3-keto-5-aminohexanoate cleavage protein [Brevibacterium spongiae]UVI37359.1 3-keto-5-aminohexanoate cleavage protein [Brevibacterium spongiae]